MMSELSLVAKATLILFAALVGTRVVRRSAASKRALILTSAFAVLLALPLMELAVPSRPVEVQLPRIASEIVSIPLPVRESRPTTGFDAALVRGSTPSSSAAPNTRTLLRVMWAIGVLIVLVRLGTALVRLRTLRRTGETWVDPTANAILRQATSRRVSTFLHRRLTTPMTCGVVHPAIGLPVEAREWPAEEIRQALIHEVEHIRRADWLVLLLAKVACALYWFHPLAWIAARRLALECEYACDDAVVRGGERASYAQQLVTMARRLSDEGVSRPVMSMADRRDLAKRIDAVLNHERPRTQLRIRTVAITAIAVAVVTVAIAPWRPMAAQVRGAVEDVLPIPTAMTGTAFASVAIRPGGGQDSGASFDAEKGLFVARNKTVFWLISQAYAAVPSLTFVPEEPYEVHDTRIKGGPEWIHTEPFNIEATTAGSVTAEDLRMMLRQLLRDSFDLFVWVDTRQTPAYRLVRTGGGGSSPAGLRPGDRSCGGRLNMEGGPGQIVRRCTTLATFAADVSLAEVLGRPMIDRTGLTGLFDISLVYAPTREELSTIYQIPVSELPLELLARPSIFTAMEQQLGLRLEPIRAAVHTLVIDHAARPHLTQVGRGAPAKAAGTQDDLSFEVVSIRRNTSGSTGGGGRPKPGGGYSFTNIPVRSIIGFAYGVPTGRVLGGPDWVPVDRYDIEAIGKPNPTDAEQTQMLSRMLRDRFGLAVRAEQRTFPVYQLVLARADGPTGPGIRRSPVDCFNPEARKKARAAAPADGLPCGFREGEGVFRGGGIQMPTLAQVLGGPAGRPVLDKTGVSGGFDIELKWRSAPDTVAGGDGVEIFTAVQEQLGLRLVSDEARLDVIVIEKIERPTDN